MDAIEIRYYLSLAMLVTLTILIIICIALYLLGCL